MACTFQVLNFYHLLEKKFNIPSFQRGYRWEKRQVTELLDDLKEFIDTVIDDYDYCKIKYGQFYCLQPIVVQPNRQQPDIYDVIDGQQRLTTIYLILQYLRNTIADNCNRTSVYSIEYNRHAQVDCYLSKNLFLEDDETKGLYKKNADNFYIYKAYQIIAEWFNAHKMYKLKIAQLLTGEINNRADKDKHDVRIIWYELPQSDSDTQAIESFTRMNEGKIALTNAELVKALLLQCSNDDKVLQQVAMRRAMEWDTIEKQLQDPLFWSMLVSEKYAPSSHIELVIDFVAQDLKEQDKDKYPYQADKELFSFLVISKAIATNAETVESIWEKIQDAYTVFRNWFYDTETYHLVGLYNLLSAGSTLNNAQKIYALFAEHTRSEAKELLRKAIGDKIRLNKDKDEKLETINYTDNSKQIIQILEAFNVYLQLSNQESTDRFRFDLFKKYNVTSLEHIHPQNLNTDNMSMEEIIEWFDGRKEASCDSTKNEVKDAAEQLNELEMQYQKSEDKKTFFATNREIIVNHINIIDSEFNELAGMESSEQMHKLYNMALVDQNTNAAISNGFLYEKRDKLRKRELNHQTYIPLGTWAAFNKQFSNRVMDMKFWSPDDRNAYFQAIETAYNYFVQQ